MRDISMILFFNFERSKFFLLERATPLCFLLSFMRVDSARTTRNRKAIYTFSAAEGVKLRRS